MYLSYNQCFIQFYRVNAYNIIPRIYNLTNIKDFIQENNKQMPKSSKVFH